MSREAMRLIVESAMVRIKGSAQFESNNWSVH